VSATCADDDGSVPLKMLLVVPVIDEFRISAVDDEKLATPTLKVPPVAVAVTLFIVGDDETLYTP
jgi:hypothetical protein